MLSDGFLFVNAGSSQPSGSKATDKAFRAFVMRKARADRAWSTKSQKLADRRKRGHMNGSEETAEAASGRGVTDQVAVAHQPAAPPDKRTTRRSLIQRCLCNPGIKGARNLCEGPDEETLRHECGRFCNHSVLCRTRQQPRVPVSGLTLSMSPSIGKSLDPFDSLAVTLDTRSHGLLLYCACSSLLHCPPIVLSLSTC